MQKNKQHFEAFPWYQALNLTERVNCLNSSNYQTLTLDYDQELAQKKIQRWRKQFPFSIDSHWNERLKVDGISSKDLSVYLGESFQSERYRLLPHPNWFVEIEQEFVFSTEIEMEHTWLGAVAPLIRKAYDQLSGLVKQLTKSYSHLPFDPETITDLLLAQLPEKLLEMMMRTLILELNVARLQGILQGDTPEQRWQNFLERLTQEEVAFALFQEYPVLLRQVKICIDHLVSFSREFLQHLCQDWPSIVDTFELNSDSIGVLTEIQGGAGDSHKQGRSVLIAKFSSGFKILYKPRSLSLDVHFQKLLTWLNQVGDHPPFATFKILDRDDYGWVEFVNVSGCETQEQVKRFYERQGGYLALLYALEATDFHNENIIAVGEHPILVDLEALFHPRLAIQQDNESKFYAYQKMLSSVLSVGLLPQKRWANENHQGIDVSGLGSQEGQLSPYEVPYIEDDGTDQMRMARKHVELPGAHNLPTLNGEKVNLPDYLECLLTGFNNMYQLLLKRRDELLNQLEAFEKDQVRVIIRNTGTYGLLLSESFHPDFLRDAIERDRWFDQLWRPIEEQPFLARVIPAERDDLWRGDIPMFTTRADSQHIWTSSGVCIENFLATSGIERAKKRIETLSERDLVQQNWFIRASVATSMTGIELHLQLKPDRQVVEVEVNREELITRAKAVGDRLEALGIFRDDRVNWIGLNLVKEKDWYLTPLGIDLYEGLPGIALFLGYLGHLTGESKYTDLAKATLAELKVQVKLAEPFMAIVGGFEGWGGIIYTLAHLGYLWQDEELYDWAESLVDLLPESIPTDRKHDIISGSAGCILGLLSLATVRANQNVWQALEQCGDRLLAREISDSTLTGFSHGAAGMAWSLLQLANLTSSEAYYHKATELINYERKLFCADQGNWPDLREFTRAILGNQTSTPFCMTAWCHGAPGIGLARLVSLPYVESDRQIKTEIEIALQTTLKQGFGDNHSLCHGDLGNLELLLQASLNPEYTSWQTQLHQMSAQVLKSIDRFGWICGVPLGVETPGLMTGITGIGYELLRLAAPELVPSILVLETPRIRSY